MSLHTIVSRGLAGWRTARVAPLPTARTVENTSVTVLRGMSMRVLEAGLAAIAIATALLLGIGR